jgi:hypothetical protein
LAVIAVVAAGCARSPVEITSAWPVAESERVVPRPPVEPRWPYTGERARSASAISRRPLSVKIENSPAARPQLGLNSADVVYETVTEGGITRFNCIFHSALPETVGPVRSARLSDLWIVPQYDGIFFFSGASSSVNARVRSAGLANMSQDVGVSRPYWRSTQRRAPHNLMLDTAKAYAEAEARGLSTTAELEPLAFGAGIETTLAVKAVDIPFSQANSVSWTYDEPSGRYLRTNNGREHNDAVNGDRVSADNVVVIWARYRAASRDMVGSTTYDVDLGGSGRATVFRDGVRIDATWEAGREAPPRFKAKDGTQVKLARGRTWFQVIPLDGRIIMR